MGHRRKRADQLHAIKGGGADLGNNVERVARVLFTDFLWPFEITAVLLVIAVVGARRARPPQRPAVRGRRARRRREPRSEPMSRRSPRRRSPTPTTWSLAAMLFTIGAVGLLVRRNVLVMFMCVELMLNAVNLTFVVVRPRAQRHPRPGDRVLHARRSRRPRSRSASAIIVAIFRRRRGATADDLDLLKD